MKCIKCGTDIPDESEFCLKCGAAQNISGELDGKKEKNLEGNRICPSCGTITDEDSKFCLKCGTNLNSGRKRGTKKGVVIAVVCFILVVIGIAGAFCINNIIKENAEKERIEKENARIAAEQERKKDIIVSSQKFFELIKETDDDFLKIGSMFSSDVGAESTWLFTTQDMINTTISIASDRIANEKTLKYTIDAEYEKVLSLFQESDTDLDNLREEIETLYLNYLSRYDLYIENNFSVETYSSLHSKSVSDYTNITEDLKQTLKELYEEYEIDTDGSGDDVTDEDTLSNNE